MRLLIDMHLTPRWVQFLRNAGYEAIHWGSVGSNSAKDGEICDYARQAVYVSLTNDLDCPQILAHTKQDAPSVVLLRGEPLVPEVRGSALVGAPQDCAAELDQDAIVTLDRYQTGKSLHRRGAETQRSAQNSCHDGVVVEWDGKPAKNAPKNGGMAA